MLYVDKAECTGCGECVAVCAEGAITLRGAKAAIDSTLCLGCGACYEVCPTGAIHELAGVPRGTGTRNRRTDSRKGKEVIKMPFLDGTGPWGQGPMTGRGLGYCTGAVRPGFGPVPTAGWFGRGRGMGRGFGRGMGRGMGRGWGLGMRRGMFWGGGAWSWPFYGSSPAYAPKMSREEEVDFLREEASAVKAQLEEIESRISELEAQKE